MQEKKPTAFKTPDVSKMQEVVLNYKTKIYIPIGADPEEARARYWNRLDAKAKSIISPKKPALS